VFLTTNGDKLHVPIIAAPATTTNGKFYFIQVPVGINAGLAATQAVSGGNVAAFDITANPGSATNPPSSNTTAGVPAVDLFGTAWQPLAGTYTIYFRVRVASNVSNSGAMNFGAWDTTGGFYTSSVTTLVPSAFAGITYQWIPFSTAPFTPIAGHNIQFRCQTGSTLTTDWFVDEAVLLPFSSTTTNSFPQDIWQQFMFQRTVTQVLKT
jgi:hypothetical protein